MSFQRVRSVVDRFVCGRCETVYSRKVADERVSHGVGAPFESPQPDDIAGGLLVRSSESLDPSSESRTFYEWICPPCKTSFKQFMLNESVYSDDCREDQELPPSVRPPVPTYGGESAAAQVVSAP